MKKVILIVAVAASLGACNNTNTKNTPEQTDSAAKKTEATPTAVDLYGTEWKLLELDGKAVTFDAAFKKEAFLVLEKETSGLHGNGGCNGFSGTYKLKENNGIELLVGGATLMACPNLAIETQFHDALEQAKNYQIEGNTLLLNNEAKKVLAKFEAGQK